jgi:hypothetical protein
MAINDHIHDPKAAEGVLDMLTAAGGEELPTKVVHESGEVEVLAGPAELAKRAALDLLEEADFPEEEGECVNGETAPPPTDKTAQKGAEPPMETGEWHMPPSTLGVRRLVDKIKEDEAFSTAYEQFLVTGNPVECIEVIAKKLKVGQAEAAQVFDAVNATPPDDGQRTTITNRAGLTATGIREGTPLVSKKTGLVEGVVRDWLDNEINVALDEFGSGDEDRSSVEDVVYSAALAGQLGDGGVGEDTRCSIRELVAGVLGNNGQEPSVDDYVQAVSTVLDEPDSGVDPEPEVLPRVGDPEPEDDLPEPEDDLPEPEDDLPEPEDDLPDPDFDDDDDEVNDFFVFPEGKQASVYPGLSVMVTETIGSFYEAEVLDVEEGSVTVVDKQGNIKETSAEFVVPLDIDSAYVDKVLEGEDVATVVHEMGCDAGEAVLESFFGRERRLMRRLSQEDDE